MSYNKLKKRYMHCDDSCFIFDIPNKVLSESITLVCRLLMCCVSLIISSGTFFCINYMYTFNAIPSVPVMWRLNFNMSSNIIIKEYTCMKFPIKIRVTFYISSQLTYNRVEWIFYLHYIHAFQSELTVSQIPGSSKIKV